jgi:hypothetical protein
VKVRHVTCLYSKVSMVILRERLGCAIDCIGLVNLCCPYVMCLLCALLYLSIERRSAEIVGTYARRGLNMIVCVTWVAWK